MERIGGKVVIIYGTISQDGARWTVQYAYEHHPEGGGSSCELQGYGQDTFDGAVEKDTLHPEAVVIDFRSASRDAVADFAIWGPMADDGQYEVPRGHKATGFDYPKRVEPLNGKPAGSLDYVNWQDRADAAAKIGATVTCWTI
jgi:hypothetical protein